MSRDAGDTGHMVLTLIPKESSACIRRRTCSGCLEHAQRRFLAQALLAGEDHHLRILRIS
ncbi:hypothetical protein VFPPC_15324 [Pochonia chlamydosporia 170]|uniref:Uncharacterized protein n=1 Tax=Pochonia chlamydosporia 170 TaxID=1380566 RepID=A0A179G7Q3_METCM|nr:hypothetical protein VFPPC_15324 [Pochonia chlamydosporia 170]OAQ73568.1 hypothetical protein VFPPC_15324 [Pochonia chlamydosporia 170]